MGSTVRKAKDFALEQPWRLTPSHFRKIDENKQGPEDKKEIMRPTLIREIEMPRNKSINVKTWLALFSIA